LQLYLTGFSIYALLFFVKTKVGARQSPSLPQHLL